jgi:iron complex outermembrane receptor protein
MNQLTLQGDGYGGAINQLANGDIRIGGGNLLGRWSHTISDGSDIKVQLYYDRTHRRIPNTFAEDLDTYDFDLQHRFPLGERQDIVWGLGYRLSEDRVDNTTNLAFLPAHLSFQIFSAFVQDEIMLVHDRLRLTLGSKFEHNDFSGFEFQPSGRLSWTVTSNQTLWAAISRAVRTPSRIDQDFFVPGNPPFALAGGPKFVSEELLAYELGYRVQPLKRLSASVATFYNDYDNLRSLEPGPPFTIANGLKGEAYGAEVAANYEMTSWWRWQAGYTYLQKHIRLKPGSMDFNQARGEGSDPENQFSVRSSMDLPGNVTLDGALRYVDLLHNIANGVRGTVPSYVELDVRLSWMPAKNLELSVVGQNLLDRQHPEFGFPGSRHEIQRGVFGKVTWRY